MPLHGVGLIVGGTLAVIGSGYAFKKFIYDPHLAPYIEAMLAQHPFLAPSEETHRSTQPIAIAVPVTASTSARTTAREPTHAKLCRRSTRRSDGDMEIREGLLSGREKEEYYLDGKGSEATIRSKPGLLTRRDMVEERPLSPRKRKSSDVHPTAHNHTSDLIDLHAEIGPISTQDAEIRSVIFDYPSLPLSPSSTPSMRMAPEAFPSVFTVSAPPLLRLSPGAVPVEPAAQDNDRLGAGLAEGGTAAESTTFSFLSLSQASSPETPRSVLGNWARGVAGAGAHGVENGVVDGQSGLHDEDMLRVEDDLISRPGTAVSDYVDAESYTPYGDRGMSPSFPAFPDVPSAPVEGSSLGLERADDMVEGGAGGRVEGPQDVGMSFIRLRSSVPPFEGGAFGVRRGPMSDVSLSESVGGGSDDWEAI